MKILLFGDSHFCARSSIIYKFGTKYSTRLENQIATFGWLKEQALKYDCGMVIGLGDLFDTSQLSDMEITAAKELPFADLPTYLLVGNHEASSQDLTFNSTKVLETSQCSVVSQPQTLIIGNTEVCLLPYVVESDRKPIAEYFPKTGRRRIILTHNDIKGINYGPVVSTTGFNISDIEANCDLYINAHIHNGQKVTSKIYNIGNITGQNFSEDATKYSHNAIILDTDSLILTYIENPHAFNFYKIDIQSEADFVQLSRLKNHAVLSIKCPPNLLEPLRARISTEANIVETRIVVSHPEAIAAQEIDISELCVDQCAKFAECCRRNLDNTILLEQELAEVLK